MRSIANIAALLAGAALVAASQASAQPRATADRPLAVEGALDARDRQNSAERRYEDHRVRLDAGTAYRISADSEAFDPMLEVYREGDFATPLEQDDDGGAGLNSRLTFTPDRTGVYVLRVLGFSSSAEGDYTLRAEVPPPLPAPQPVLATVETTTWTVLEGVLDDSDPEGDWGRFDDYLVTLRAGEELLVRADSDEFDTMVHVLAADGREGDPIATDDDSGGGLNSLLVFVPDEPGDYVVRVTAYSRGDGGRYRLRIGR